VTRISRIGRRIIICMAVIALIALVWSVLHHAAHP
jgi:hypothetical protein